MPVRKTESRLPAGFTAPDMGQSAADAANSKIVLVSFFSSPCALRRTQVYVVFVTDTAVASQVGKYEWTFVNGINPPLVTDEGVAEFTPQNLGALNVTVKLKGGGGAVLATITLSQQVIPLNNDLEVLIDQEDKNVPLAAHPETSRELLNDIRGYINVLLPGAADELYNKMLSSVAYARCLEPVGTGDPQLVQFRRHLLLERLAAVINSGNHKDFLSAAKNGFGICKSRPQLVAMFLKRPSATDPYINLVELPDAKAKRPAAEKAIATAFNDATKVTEEHKIDLFNLLRFPKSHLAMVKLVVDGLQAKYFASATVPQLLKDKKKGESLLTQFEAGPIAMGGSFKTTAASSQIFKLLAQKIWTIKVAPIAGAPVGGGAATATPGPVGTPEDAPEITFIAKASPTDNGFLASATLYHATFGLNPQVAKSFEDIVRILATSTTPIKRLRIVSHFSLDPKAVTAQVFIPLFDNQLHPSGDEYFHAERWHFEYGNSDAAGLQAHFENEAIPIQKPGFLSTLLTEAESPNPGAKQIALHAALFKVLKTRNDPSLVPFKFKNSGPADTALTLFKLGGDLFALDHMQLMWKGANPTVAQAQVPVPIINAFKTFIRAEIDKLKKGSGVMIAANVNAIITALTALGIADLPFPDGRSSLNSVTFTLPGVFLQDHTTFRNRLSTVRGRLKDGFVDIRGCRIGQDKAYMEAMRAFFGTSAQKPIVTGPVWLQSFGKKGELGAGNEFTIDTVFASGHAPFDLTGADVQRSYQDWSGMMGLAAQLSFWSQLFSGNPIPFLARTWIAGLPPIGVEATRVTGLSALSYPDLLVRLREVFFIDPTTGPSAVEAGNFDAGSMASVKALNTAIDAVDQLPANAAQPVLQALLADLQAVAVATGQVLSSAPSPLTIDFLRICIVQLSAPLALASKIHPLLAALKAKADHTNFGIRYMLGAGLPLLVQSAKSENGIYVMFFTPQLAQAVKSAMAIQWRQPLPPAVRAAIAALNPVGSGTTDPTTRLPNNDTARAEQFSQLEIDHANTQVTVNPENEFASLITRVP